MKLSIHNSKLARPGFSLKEAMLTLGILLTGLTLTAIAIKILRENLLTIAKQEFEYTCKELASKIDTRLDVHAQLLRSGSALFAVSDTVSREEWKNFYTETRMSTMLPGIEGFGYSKIILPEELKQHELSFSQQFPDYRVNPRGTRDIYTSIIYIEPFQGRNLRAFGYDMYSEPVRKKAMALSRDSGTAMLSGKVELVQEKGENEPQPGVLMYIPVYRKNLPLNTIEQRRAAIRGWVFSPYRMRDLIGSILETMNVIGVDSLNPIRIQIYDNDKISDETLLFDDVIGDTIERDRFPLTVPLTIDFNGKKWTLVFSGTREQLSIFHRDQMTVLIGGIIIGMLLFFLSLTVLKTNLRRKQIEQLNIQLEKVNMDKDRFIAILSHDLKSPFTAILGFLEILLENLQNLNRNEIKKHVNIINDASRHTFNLLEDLLTWTRAHSGKIPFNPKLLRLKEVFDHVLKVMKESASSKKISVIYHEEEEVYVIADIDMLMAILRNLVSNAIKFTKPGGTVKVTAEKKPRDIEISVSDNGVGMMPDQMKELYDITKFMSTTGTANERGSGFGLLICKEFVEKHCGKLSVTSEFGKGSDFRFTIPQ